jgi:hypothetical protein
MGAVTICIYHDISIEPVNGSYPQCSDIFSPASEMGTNKHEQLLVEQSLIDFVELG